MILTTVVISVRGLVVMIVACQVMDPGSIPGERIFFVVCCLSLWPYGYGAALRRQRLRVRVAPGTLLGIVQGCLVGQVWPSG